MPNCSSNQTSQEIDVNAADYDARTALHLAAAENHVDTVLYLLSAGASTSLKDRWGNTPIDDAQRGGFSHLCGILTAHAATPKAEATNLLRQKATRNKTLHSAATSVTSSSSPTLGSLSGSTKGIEKATARH
jgi:ankyrin repeat protein